MNLKTLIPIFFVLGLSFQANALDADKDSIQDSIELGGLSLSNVDTDLDGIDNTLDIDSTFGSDANSDGIDDSFTLRDTDGDSIPDFLDKDSDNDGIPDVIETDSDNDFDSVANYLDLDSNNNSLLDKLESNVTGLDSDSDLIDDGYDADLDGTPGTDAGKVDANNDGIIDNVFKDVNSNGLIDSQELDFDLDGIPAPLESGASGNDTDNDGIDDSFDADDDGVLGEDVSGTDENNDGILDQKVLDADLDRDELLNSSDSDSDGDGITDFDESGVVGTDFDSDGIDDVFDANSDGDDTTDLGKVDQNEDGIHDGFIGTDTDNDGVPDYLDRDSDGDGIPDIIETSQDFDNDDVPNYRDTDSDGDGLTDFLEGSASGNDFDNDGIDDNFDADADGGGGIDVGKLDTNNDGIDDNVSFDLNNNGTADYLDTALPDGIEETLDADADGIPNLIENQVSGIDIDTDGIDDAFDADRDGTPGTDADRVDENSDGIDETLWPDLDHDGIPNSLDTDSDNDGISDEIESRTITEDIDQDGIVDYFDADLDNDGSPDLNQTDTNLDGIEDTKKGIDSDADGIADYLDYDSDNDTIPDALEANDDNDADDLANYRDLDSDNDGISDEQESRIIRADIDNDGIDDFYDASIDGDHLADPGKLDNNQDGIHDSVSVLDSDGDNNPDFIDLDSDGDRIPDLIETHADLDADGIPNYLDEDSDGDLIGDQSESGASGLDTDDDGIDDSFDIDADGGGGIDSGKSDVDGNGLYEDGLTDINNNDVYDFLEKFDGNNTALAAKDTDNDGIPDRIENNEVGVDRDADGIDDALDSDHDGILGTDPDKEDKNNDGIDDNALLDTDNDGLANYLDPDSDNDGIPDLVEADVSGNDQDLDGIDDSFDANTDNDTAIDLGKTDANDDGIDDNNKGTNTDGDSVPDYFDTDSDNDGIPDAIEGMVDSDNDGIPNYRDTDSDNDGISDSVEAKVSGVDTDSDGIDDLFDADVDGGGGIDAGKQDANADGVNDLIVLDHDGNGIAEYLEFPLSGRNPNADADADGIPNIIECPLPDGATIDQFPMDCPNTDGDSSSSDLSNTGGLDMFDTDSDGDGILDRVERGINGLVPWDTDNDGVFNFRDLDSDNDLLSDEAEVIDANEDGILDDADLDGIPDFVDAADNKNDGDLVPDSLECPLYPLCPDMDNDGQPDYSDNDSDNDGIPDRIELFAIEDTDADGIADYYDADADANGIIDTGKLDENNDGITDNRVLPDLDGDNIANHQDLDSDGDGLSDTEESIAVQMDDDSDGIDNAFDVDMTLGSDIDYDGIDDSKLSYSNKDSDKDGIPDYLDVGIDSDKDGIDDGLECKSFPQCVLLDKDKDGIADYMDPQTSQNIDGGVDGVGANHWVFTLGLLLLACLSKRPLVPTLLFKRVIKFFMMIFVFISPVANSEVYLGLGATYGKQQVVEDNEFLKEKSTFINGSKIYLGWQATPLVGFDVSLANLGTSTITNTLAEGGQTTLSHYSYSAVMNYKIEELSNALLSPYVKLGITRLDREGGNDSLTLDTNSQVKPLYGLGLGVALNDKWKLKSELEFINLKSTYWASVSLEYKFGMSSRNYRDADSINTLRDNIKSQTPSGQDDAAQVASIAVSGGAPDAVASYCEHLDQLQADIHFQPLTTQLTEQGRNALKYVAILQHANKRFGLRYEVKGYAEAVGKPALSLTLSEQRARAVKQFLVKLGIDSNSMIYQGYGESAGDSKGASIGVKINVLNADQCADY
jgi:outer membrane protein OmpA-like peptidoglycan-associated protein